MTQSLAILCSGQGDQHRGMFDLVADAPEAQAVFAAASAALGGCDPREVVANRPDSELHTDKIAQILCCTQALAAWAVLKPKLAARRVVVAGYSIGEVAAWGVAGSFTPATVFDVAARRASWMDAATTDPAGLLAIRGLTPHTIEALCRETGVWIAIRNAADRVIVGGLREALTRTGELAKQRGALAVSQVPVGVASHTPLLGKAAAELGVYLAGLPGVFDPASRLLSGTDGAAVFDRAEGLAKLAQQVAETVDWAACMEACHAAGATRALELGPGNALARLMSEVIDGGDSRSLADFRSLAGVLTWLSA